MNMNRPWTRTDHSIRAVMAGRKVDSSKDADHGPPSEIMNDLCVVRPAVTLSQPPLWGDYWKTRKGFYGSYWVLLGHLEKRLKLKWNMDTCSNDWIETCAFCLSVAAHTMVETDPSLTDALPVVGRSNSQETTSYLLIWLIMVDLFLSVILCVMYKSW